MAVNFTPASKINFTPESSGNSTNVLDNINPEVIAKRNTAYILSNELGLDSNVVNASYGGIVKNVYGETLTPSQVQKRMEEDGLFVNPKADNDEINTIAESVIRGEEPPSDLIAKRYKRQVTKQTSEIFSKLRSEEEELFSAPTNWLSEIDSKPDEKFGEISSLPIYEDKDLLDINTYKSLLEQMPTKQAVQDLRAERKALVSKSFFDTVNQQAEYFSRKETPIPRNQYPKLSSISLGLYSAATTIERGIWGTSVAVGMEWNRPSQENTEKRLEEIGIAWETMPGKMPFVIGAVSEAIPNFAYNMTVGKVGIFMTEYGNAYSDAINNDASEKQANAIALPVATINTVIESMQLDRIAKMVGVGKPVIATIKKSIKDNAYKVFLKKGAQFTGEIVKSSVNEGFEGWLQEGSQIAMPAWVLGVYPKDENGNVDWFNILGQMNRSFIGEGLGGAFLGGAGSIYNAKQISNYKTELAAKLYVNEGLSEQDALQTATNIVERLRSSDGQPQDVMREEISKVKPVDNRHKAAAHIIKNGKEMSDGQYRSIATKTTGKDSIKDMTYDEAERFIDALKVAEVKKEEKKPKKEGEPKKKEITPEQIAKDVEAIRDETENQPDEYEEPLSESVPATPDVALPQAEAGGGKLTKPRRKRGGFLDNAPIGDEDKLRQKIEELLGEKPKPKKVFKKETKKEEEESVLATTKTAIGQSLDQAGKGIDRAFGLLSTRLRNISTGLFQDVRNKYINNTLTTISDRVKVAHGLVDGIRAKFSAEDKKAFDKAVWQADDETINKAIAKYGLEDEYVKFRSMMDVIYHEAKAVGMDIEYLDVYFPSKVKDFEGLMDQLNRQERYEPIVMAMLMATDEKGRKLSRDEQIQIIDSLLRGYQVSGITLSKPGFAKERTVPREDLSLKKYYYGFEESISRYVESMTESIHARQFFGKTTDEIVKLRAGISRNETNIARYQKDKSKDHKADIKRAKTKIEKLQAVLDKKDDGSLDNSIGAYVLDLIESGKIKYGQQKELLQIFQGIFQTTKTDKWLQTAKSLEYAGSLAQVSAVLTQYGEIILPLLYAPSSTLPNLVKAHLNKSGIKLSDIGVAHIGQEWVDADLDGAVKWLMRPFELADRVGKETYVNSIVDKYRKMAVKNPDKAREEIRKYYPEEGVESVLNSLKSGEVDNNVKGFALNELADVQPISKMEVPELYAKAGNWRVFYMYKTFILKRIDILRREGFAEIKAGVKGRDKERILKGIARLLWLSLMFTLADSSMDAIKDFVRGKPLDKIENYVIDNLLQMMMLSKYSASKARREGPGVFLYDNIALPISNINAAGKDVMTLMDEDSEKGSEFVRRIPWIGDMYYWYFGEGARKIDEGVYDED